MLRFLFHNLRGYRFLVVLAIIMTVLEVGADIAAAWPLKFVLDKINKNPQDPTTPFPFSTSFVEWVLHFFDRFGTPLNGRGHTIVGAILLGVSLLIVLSIVDAILTYIQLRLAVFVAQHLSARLRSQLFEHLQRLTLDWHGKQKKGDLVQRIIGNITDIEKLVTDGLVDLLAGILTMLGILAVTLLISWQFTVIALIIVPVLLVTVFQYTRSIKMAAKKASKTAGQVASVAAEDLGAVTVMKAFTLETRETVRFARYVGENRDAALRAGSLQAQFTPLVTVLVALGTATILGVGAYVVSSPPGVTLLIPAGSITIGTLLLFLTYLNMLYQPMRNISKLANLWSSAASGAERIQEVLHQAPEVLESSIPYHGPEKLRGDIVFERVTFGYTPDRPILKGIDLHIPPGRKVALVGLSGDGKTTLVKLIPRFYDLKDGSLRIDQIEHRLYPLKLLRQNVSFVLQESVLFEGNIRDNIELGKPGASMEEIVDAAKKAHIHDTILHLPDGYETEVREQGKNLSGGQRQRLAIARAILRDAPILVLDEPTASLDVEAEVIHALDSLIENRTVLMISHRLNTLQNVDEIIVLQRGRIVEQGTYRELKRKGGVFAQLLAEQNRYNAERLNEQSIIKPVIPLALPNERGHVPPPPLVPPQRVWLPAVPGREAARMNKPPVMRNHLPPAPACQQACVLVEVEGKIISKYHLNKPLLTVGRLSTNDVQVPSQQVSRLHAKISWEQGAWVIEDAESLNGLSSQGTRFDRLGLTNGDRICLAPGAVLHYRTTP